MPDPEDRFSIKLSLYKGGEQIPRWGVEWNKLPYDGVLKMQAIFAEVIPNLQQLGEETAAATKPSRASGK